MATRLVSGVGINPISISGFEAHPLLRGSAAGVGRRDEPREAAARRGLPISQCHGRTRSDGDYAVAFFSADGPGIRPLTTHPRQTLPLF